MICIPLWVLTGAYACHIIEEYRFNWREWAMRLSKLDLKWSEFYIVNAAVLVFGIASAIVGYSFSRFSYLFVGLALVNALVAHIGATIVKGKYSPGTLTSIILFVPICIWAYYDAYQNAYIDIETIALTVLGGFLIMLIPIGLQLLKNMVSKRKNSQR
ncbi:MAG: HXXEE domain-containing protein [Clostridiales Family XIII bacterium]|nr:HXXEE domain-containing protein [Clostridiales Family XIII bacterium]